jgi:hypothetical protein
MEVNGQFHAPAVLPLGERDFDTHCLGHLMGSRASLDAVNYRKIYPSSPAVTRRSTD